MMIINLTTSSKTNTKEGGDRENESERKKKYFVLFYTFIFIYVHVLMSRSIIFLQHRSTNRRILSHITRTRFLFSLIINEELRFANITKLFEHFQSIIIIALFRRCRPSDRYSFENASKNPLITLEIFVSYGKQHFNIDRLIRNKEIVSFFLSFFLLSCCICVTAINIDIGS